MPFYRVYLLPERNIGWATDKGDDDKEHIWLNLLVDIYFPKANTIYAVRLIYCLELFHKLQRCAIISHVTRVLVQQGYKNTKLPIFWKAGSTLVGAYPGDPTHSKLAIMAKNLKDFKTTGPLYPDSDITTTTFLAIHISSREEKLKEFFSNLATLFSLHMIVSHTP